MKIICINQGTKYPIEYVYKLRRMCERHIPHDSFTCMTDQAIPNVHTIPMNSPYLGWWSKVGLFREGFFPGDTLYLDLDVVITAGIPNSIALFEQGRTKLWAPDDFSYSLVKPRGGLSAEFMETLGGVGTINSSVMLWNGTEARLQDVYSDFAMRDIGRLHGDQNWITQKLWERNSVGLLPETEIYSFKYGERLPYPITIFHGTPKPHEVPEPWVKEAWA